MKTAEDFKKQIKIINKSFWLHHNCSICGVMVGYVFVKDEVFYDSGCDCGYNPNSVTPRTWDEIAEYYNRQDNEKIISEMNRFWGFNNDN